MTHFRPATHFSLALTLTFSLSATTALAQLAPEQVWEDWKSNLASFGYEVTGETNQTGTTLTVSDLALTMAMPEETGSVSMRLGKVQMIGNDDGSVSVVVPERMPIAIETLDIDGQEVTTTLELAHQGLDVKVSGTPDAMRYDYSAKQLSMGVMDLVAGGKSADIKVASIRLSDIVGTNASAADGDMRKLTQTIAAGPVTYEIDVTAPDEGGRLVFNGTVARGTFDGTTRLPQSFDAEDMAASLAAGFQFDSRFKYQAGSSAYRFEDGDDVIEGTQGSESGELMAAIGTDGLRYGGEGLKSTITMTGTDLPFPVTLEMARAAFAIVMPVAKSEAAQDFALKLDLSDFTMSDMIWSLFDPASKLPRDPATLAIDLSGKGRLFFDLLDPTTASKLEAEEVAPGELEALDLNTLTLSLAGARLTGTGAFVFDQSDLTSFDGMAAPEGSLDLELVGGNTLLDRLVELGILPQDQATGVRMMMGLFATPGEGEDKLTSRIEFTEDGQVLANGQRLK